MLVFVCYFLKILNIFQYFFKNNIKITIKRCLKCACSVMSYKSYTGQCSFSERKNKNIN